MAVLYQATLVPSKFELLQAWVPRQPWFRDADPSDLEVVGAYRFDDPDGEVGLETHLLRTTDHRVFQVPVTYRASPLPDPHALLISTAQHSVLGERWVYDACSDPVYAMALATAVLTGGTQAEIDVLTETGKDRQPATTRVSGSGSPGTPLPPTGPVSCSNSGDTTVIRIGHLRMTILRTIEPQRENSDGTDTLMGTWPGQDTPALLAIAGITH